MSTTTQPQPCIHLQYVGYHRAKPVEDFQPGDVLVWNHGYTSVCVSVRKLSPHYCELLETWHDRVENCEKTTPRRVKAGRLLGWGRK